MNKILLSICVVLGIMIYSSCEDPVRTVMTNSERDLLDSLYAKRVPYARKQADSICDAQYQIIFDRIADSIKQVYIEEINEIIQGEG